MIKKQEEFNLLLTAIFCHIDDFCNELNKHVLEDASNRGRLHWIGCGMQQ